MPSCSRCARTVIPHIRGSRGPPCTGVGSSGSSGGDFAQRQPEKERTTIDTIFDTKDLAGLIDEAEREGMIEEITLDTKALELELDDDELVLLREELESRGVEITAADADDEVVDLEPEHESDELAADEGRGDARLSADLRGVTDSVTLFMNEIGNHDLLTAADEIALAKRIERGDLQAKERMVNSNLRLVVANARCYQNLGLPLLDLIQEGTLGLIRAVEKFDWRRGLKFSTYATFWIRQAMTRALETRVRTIKLPIELIQRERKIARAESQLWSELGREPTAEEVARRAELTVEEVQATRAAPRAVTSLEKPVGEEGDSELGALVSDEGPEPADVAELSLTEETVRRAVAELPEREQEVVKLRYGLNGDREPATMAEVGRRLGISATSVKNIEERGLSRLAERRELGSLREAA